MPTLTDDVRSVLDRCTVTSNTITIPGQLDRSMYVQVNKALVALGGKWNRSAKAHVFPDDPRDRFDELIATGVIPKPEQKLNSYWPTPEDLADRLAKPFAVLGATATILEPSAGTGALVRAVRRVNEVSRIVAVEPDLNRVREIRAGHGSVHCSTFETWLARPDATADAVIMNPPFTVPGDNLAWATHLELALSLLEDGDGGRIMAILPTSLLFRRDRRVSQLRDRLDQHSTVTEVLHDGAFASVGTGVRTVLVDVEVR